MNKPSHEYCKDCKDWNGSIVNCMEICSIPINIIEEWEKYHAIGTVEECREAVDKMKPKKTAIEAIKVHICPVCGFGGIYDYCGNCGQRVQMLSD